jgi:Icc-related predicted phosphoesterase
VIRIAAVGDVHFGTDSRGTLRPALARLQERADVLLLAGDLTCHGSVDEVAVLAEELDGVGVPIVAVLGNHDYHSDQEHEITALLTDHGIRVLEQEAVVVDTAGGQLGIAGTKGFGGGFAGACGTEFGEPEMKAFIRHTKRLAEGLERALRSLDVACRVALLHVAPVPDTLRGERLEIYPFLGSYLLAEACDRAGADLIIHGHAHVGSEKGVTAGGIPVRNVAQPVIGHAYRLYCVGNGEPLESLPAARGAGVLASPQ